jgi:hypothetical protein
MNGPQKDERIVVEGRRAIVEYAALADGTMEAKLWLDSQEESIRASFEVLFRRLADNGPLFPNKEQFKKLKDISDADVWEFKRGGELGNRIFCVEHGRRWLLTHHFCKKGSSKKDQTKSAKRAAVIANEQLEHERQAIQGEMP